MQLYNMKNIRQSKRISRKTLAEYLKVHEDVIKDLETKQFECVMDMYDTLDLVDIVDTIADYLNVSRTDLVLPDFKAINKDIRKFYETFKIKVSDSITEDYMKSTLIKVLENNNNCIGPDNLDKFIAELSYRIGDPEDSDNKDRAQKFKKLIADLEFNIDDSLYNNFGPIYDKSKLLGTNISFYVDEDLGFNKQNIDNIRREARTAATLYKELVANKLPHEICIDILKAMLDETI